MKIRANTAQLADTLQWVGLAVPKRPSAPALAGIKMTADADGTLTLQAFDYDTGHSARVPVTVITPGEVLVSGRYLSMVVAGLRGKEVELVLDGSALTITSGRSIYRMQTMRSSDYPAVPEFEGRVGVIDSGALARLVATVAAPIDDNTPHEQAVGIHLETADDDSGLWAVGSDGSARSIHVAVAQWSQDADLNATVPSAALTTAIKGLNGSIEIGHTDGTLSLRDDTRTVTLRTYATTYLRGKWRSLLEQTMSRDGVIVTTNGAELAGAIKRAAAFGEDGRESYVGIIVRPDSITIAAGTEGCDGEDVIDAEMFGDDPAWLGANANLLAMALAAVGNEPVNIELAESGLVKATQVVYVRPADRDDAHFLVMPRTWTGGNPA